MKRILGLIVGILICTSAYAQNPLMKVKSGSLDIFKAEVNIKVDIDDYNAIIAGPNQRAEEFYATKGGSAYTDFCSDLIRAHKSFISYYNAEKGNIKSTVGESSDYPYTLQIYVTHMNVGNAGASVIGLSHKSGGALINGTMKLVDNATNEVQCEIEFNGIKGMRSPNFNGRAISVYRYLAEALLSIIK